MSVRLSGAAPVHPRRDFAARVVRWQCVHGRNDLPWQDGWWDDRGGCRDDLNYADPNRKAYRVWLSEIMLQQTRVATVIPYYLRFLERFPSLRSLADAPLEEVLKLWSGLGYYSRARNLHLAAQRVVNDCAGTFPRSVDELCTLPGIGRSTAGAIAALAFGVRAAILDANVGRVLRRAFADRADAVSGGSGFIEKRLWLLAEELLPRHDIAAYTQGLMDLGATVCSPRNPRCACCPIADICAAHMCSEAGALSALQPATRRKAPRPERATVMVVLRHEDGVWLRRRPPTGIWGGLWSLPELRAPGVAAEAYRLAEEYGRVANIEALDGFTHGFTHFTLHAEVFQATMIDLRRNRAMHDAAAGAQWLALNDVRGAALPSPVKKLLLALSGRPAVAADNAPGHQSLLWKLPTGASEATMDDVFGGLLPG